MSEQDLHIGFIGGGNMARAIVGGLLDAGHPAARLRVADPDAAQRERLARDCPGVACDAGNAAAAAADIVVLAVKPQVLMDALGALPAPAGEPPLYVSIAAGVSLASLAAALPAGAPLVRVMPNQPAMVRAGMSVLTGSPGLGAVQRRRATYITDAVGESAWLDDEALMDAVTALSGSGPAYFYLLLELLEEAGAALGLAPGLARQLARQTAHGAAQTALETGLPPAQLRAMVTSKGGTTEAALAAFEAGGLAALVHAALRAARDRGRELGRNA